MRKLRILEHISLDGIIQAPGAPNEDGDYPYGGWAYPFRDPAISAAILEAHAERFDLILGRRTYDIWAQHWPNAKPGPLTDSFNAATKYVATHRPDTLSWGPSEGLGPDFLEGVRRVQAQTGPDLILWGSSTLTSTLLDHGLVDEVLLFIHPLLLGKGKRFFSEGTLPKELALRCSQAVPSGVVIGAYTPHGPLRTGSFADAST